MKKSNPFLILGATGFFITLFIHLLLYSLENVSLGFMMSFYPVWIVFLVIGIRKTPLNKMVVNN